MIFSTAENTIIVIYTGVDYAGSTTVPTFNFCTKCLDNPGTINDRTPRATQFP